MENQENRPVDEPEQPKAQAYKLTPEQIEQAKRDSEQLNNLWTSMEVERPPFYQDPDKLRTVAICACIGVCFVVFLLLLANRSGQPWALFGGAASLCLAVYIYSQSESRTAATGSLTALFGFSGGIMLMMGLMWPKPEPQEVDENVRLLAEQLGVQFESDMARFENGYHTPVTQNWQPAQMAEFQRMVDQEMGRVMSRMPEAGQWSQQDVEEYQRMIEAEIDRVHQEIQRQQALNQQLTPSTFNPGALEKD